MIFTDPKQMDKLINKSNPVIIQLLPILPAADQMLLNSSGKTHREPAVIPGVLFPNNNLQFGK